MDSSLEDRNGRNNGSDAGTNFAYSSWLVALIAFAVFAGCAISPPSLMDDVDSVQAQIARNMLTSGDWITAKLDGVKYLEKSPLWYWAIAICFRLFGTYDWVARLPVVFSCVGLCWVTTRIGQWAFSKEAGFYAGLVLSTCLGLFLFTRILIPDVCLTLFIALTLWAFLRAIDDAEIHHRAWSLIAAMSIAVGVLLKGLIAGVFPIGIAVVHLAITGEWRSKQTWKRLHLGWSIFAFLVIATPWHVLATLRNPPYFASTLHSGPGEYKGFFWFYFINEHLLRFLNTRYPRDYNTVPRLWFWLLHFAWLFPWSAFLPAAIKLRYGTKTMGDKLRLLCAVWIGFILLFFTFSTTQEYYSLPCYPAIALLIGCSMAARADRNRMPLWILTAVMGSASLACIGLLALSHGLPHPGDISRALTQNPSAYTLSLGHMGDLTIASFAYLQAPLLLAAVGFAIGALAALAKRRLRVYAGLAIAMIVFLQAARLAMVTFDPYLSSRPLADALLKGSPGQVIFDDQYYTFSSVAFYADTKMLLLNGRVNNLEYGSNAPGAPHVFIGDRDLQRLWSGERRFYLFTEQPAVRRISKLVGESNLHVMVASGGKFLFSNLR